MSDEDMDFAAFAASTDDYTIDSEWRGDSPPAMTAEYYQNPHNRIHHFPLSDQDSKMHTHDHGVLDSAASTGRGSPDISKDRLLEDESALSFTQQPPTSSSESLFSSSQNSSSDISKQTSMTALSSLVGRAEETKHPDRSCEDSVLQTRENTSSLKTSRSLRSLADPWSLKQQLPHTAVGEDDSDMIDEVLQTGDDAHQNLNYDDYLINEDEVDDNKENVSSINTEGVKPEITGPNSDLYASKFDGIDGRLHQDATPPVPPLITESTIGSDLSPYSAGPSPFDFASANSSPTYDDPTTSAFNSPPPFSSGILSTAPTADDAQQHRKGHHKAASQYSLSQSMNNLNTAAAHEVSPGTNFRFGEAPSSQAFAQPFQPFPNNSDVWSGFWGGDGAGPIQMVSDLLCSQKAPTCPNPAWQGNAMQWQQLTNGANTRTSPTHQSLGTPAQLFTNPRPPLQFAVGIEPHKSRVETQIPVTFLLSYLPPDVTKLRLPPHTIAKPKLLAKNIPEHSPDTLELYTMVVRSTAMDDESNRQRAFELAAAATYGPQSRPRDDGSEDGDSIRPADGGEVWICDSCIQRERKRSNRKKSKKPEEDEGWSRAEHRRIVIFNSNEIRDWQHPAPAAMPPQCDNAAVSIQMRLACYCRHHGEKTGFRVIFTLKDYLGRVLAQNLSRSIMITDDHKTPTSNLAGSASAARSLADVNAMTIAVADIAMPLSSTSPAAASIFEPSPKAGKIKAQGGAASTAELPAMKRGSVTLAASDAAESASASKYTTPVASGSPSAAIARALSRSASPNGLKGHAAKKRKSSAGINTLPTGLTMTRINTSPHAQQSATQSRATAGNRLAAASTSPVAQYSGDPNIGTLSGIVPMNAEPQQLTGSLTPNSHNDPATALGSGNRSSSFDSLAPRFSAPTSRHASRPSSPSDLLSSMQLIQQQLFQHQQQQLQRQLNQGSFPQQFQNSPLSIPMPMSQPTTSQISQPVIHRVIPAEGPQSGGIEVTILGSSFYQGLDVMFGDQRATTTTFWGESSLVCLVPPSPIPGLVPVTISQSNQRGLPQPFVATQQRTFFKYYDDNEQQLLRTAFTILSTKITGKIEDAQEIARRIIGSDNMNWGTSNGGASGGGSAGNPDNLALNMNTSNPSFESRLLKVLELIDLDESKFQIDLNMRHLSTGGHSMLHLACVLGMHRFVAGLLARGANPDVRDNGGYTPLHLAALNNQPEIVRRLIHAGADPTMRTLSGLTASEVTGSRVILRAIERLERHARSRSSGSLHTLTSSAASLRSLRESMTMTATHRRASCAAVDRYKTEGSTESSIGADCDSSSYGTSSSPEADSEQEEEEEVEWLEMRQGSRDISRSSTSKHVRHVVRDISNSPDALAASTTTDVAEATARGLDISMAQASPAAAAVAAVKDQLFAHFQQVVAQFPHIPNNPLPDYYQAYLNSAAFQRISSLVPNISIGTAVGSRPNSSDSNSGGDDGVGDRKGFEGRWGGLWLNMAGLAPPPPYEEIFPHKTGDLDTKTATAAAAAAEAEADTKCSTLYDNQHVEVETKQQTATMATAATAVTKDNGEVVEEEGDDAASVPVLQIGRKHQITKEQQENFRRVHKEKRKGLGSDTFLYTVWIPLLLGVLVLWLSGARAWDSLPSVKFNMPYATSLNNPARQTSTDGNNDNSKGTIGNSAGDKPILPPNPAEAVVRHNDGHDIVGAIAGIVA
ncbi:SPT3 Dosage dependent suppressor of Ty-induced promoter mutations-like protein [Sporothrix epigloea]|uniref:SPT3 Dosage dependent suppressor of Ty-induced promoter mutations-like protein n=1 Tax=Sporothrix epigloea TaxID=1892477 RepID=A0ABP0DF31_9PEZI